MKRFTLILAASCGAIASTQAIAQNNPFMPPASGLSRAQIQEIVRQEVERAKGSAKSGPSAGPSALDGAGGVQSQMKGGPDVGGLPQQKGGNAARPNVAGGPPGSPAATAAAAAAAAADPVAEMLKDGGTFVGCVASTPVFKDKSGRRAYFTTKELRESNAARRYTRC